MGRSDREREGEVRSRDYRDRDREPPNRKERRHEPEETWRDVRIKDEPMSDVEGRSRQQQPDSRPHHRPSDKNLGQPRRERSRERRSRSRSRSRDRDRGRDRHDQSREGNRRESDSPQYRSRDREHHRSSRPTGSHQGRSSPDRSRARDNQRPEREHDRGSRGRGGGGGRGRPAREKDWDNFFNPRTSIKQEREDEDSKYGKKEDEDEEPPKEKEKPNFGLSGKLTEETNTFRGVVIKYSEPPEARKPQKIRWRLYPFKGEQSLDVMYIHRQSAYLLGRDRKIADIPIDHPSCSKQHAVIQFRLVPYKRANGTSGRRIKPYVIDLESGNGTYVNGDKIEPKRYVELFEKDVLKFGYSSREYVLLNEHSKADVEDDEPETNSPEVDEKVLIKAEKMED